MPIRTTEVATRRRQAERVRAALAITEPNERLRSEHLLKVLNGNPEGIKSLLEQANTGVLHDRAIRALALAKICSDKSQYMEKERNLAKSALSKMSMNEGVLNHLELISAKTHLAEIKALAQKAVRLMTEAKHD
ncbi:MAG: hypothetical protein WC792_05535 [Candidatus Micrarchaeia archaeon]|jgi:hypothetical protein